MRKGDIVLVAFPFTDPSGAKVRPAVVLWASPHGEDVIAVFISSASTKKKVRFSISVRPSASNGLKKPSHIRVGKLATLQKKSALGKLGTLEPALQVRLDSMLRNVFRI